MRERGAEAEARWRGLVSEQMGSGKSVAAFCRERGVPASQMFSWKKRFREAESAKFVEVAVNPARIWLAVEAMDMRCGFDRLAERVKAVINQDPLSGHLFVFRSRRGERLKILTWDRDGYMLWYKRLEAGVFKLPRIKEGAHSMELRPSELAMILDGIDMTKLKRVPRYERTNAGNRENVAV